MTDAPTPKPPPLPGAKGGTFDLRFAAVLNLALPGAGLVYLGRRGIGFLHVLLFGACFVALLSIFLVGYARYLSLALSDDLMRGDTIEQAGASFQPAWLIVLGVFALGLHLSSSILFARAKRKFERENRR